MEVVANRLVHGYAPPPRFPLLFHSPFSTLVITSAAATTTTTTTTTTTSSTPTPTRHLAHHPRSPTSWAATNFGFGDKRRISTAMATEKVSAFLEPTAKQDNSKASKLLQLTHLEGNSWLWDIAGISILVDPILVGNLDFGLPWLYSGGKKELRNLKLENLPRVDYLLITQGLDDHCHKRTLEPLSRLYPGLRVIATPNAEFILSKLFNKVTYLEPGDTAVLQADSGSEVLVKASAGPVLGPPWQRPENGYFLEAKEQELSLYYEPHCVYDQNSLKNKTADVIVTPVIKQVLPSFTLVSGQEDAVQLAQLLQPKYIVIMNNGDLETTGFLSRIVSQVGTVASFKELLSKVLPNVVVLEPQAGIPLEVPIFC